MNIRITRWLTSHHAVTTFLVLSALEGLATVIYQLSMPADPTNSVLFGYSLRRLAVIAVVFVFSLFFVILAFKAGRDINWTERLVSYLSHAKILPAILLPLLFLFALLFATLALTPPLRFMPYDLFFKGMLPPIRLAAAVCVEAAILLAGLRYGIYWHRLVPALQDERKLIRASLVILGAIILAWAVIIVSRIGLTPDVAYWNAPGVPLMAVQVLAAWVIGIGFLTAGLLPAKKEAKIELGKKASLRTDFIICLLLWIISAALWMHEPQVRSFFGPGPSQPNNEYYPLSDAAGYDIAAQYALIGQGLDNGHHVDKPLYSNLLVFLHLLAGQDYTKLVMLQSALLALIPVLLYLLGRSLHSRPAGIVAGALSAFKGQNAIASAWMVLSANPKLIVSEYPMTLGMVLFTYFMVKWLKKPEKAYLFGMLAGGIFGLNTMIRHNVWLLLPFALLALWLACSLNLRKWLRSGSLFLVVLLFTILPWMWRTYQKTETPIFFMPMLQNVFSQRYDFILPGTSWSTPVPVIPTVSSEAVAPASMTSAGQSDSELAYPAISTTWHADNFAGTGMFDAGDGTIRYSGDWLTVENGHAYQETLHFSTVAGNSAHLEFAGDQITISYPIHSGYGELEISIDGETAGTLLQGEDDSEEMQQWQSDLMVNGRHELTLTHSSGSMVAIDAFLIQGLSPDYRRSDECPSAVPYHWINANLDSGLRSDDGLVAHELPFTFLLNGEPYRQVYISANGIIAFQEFNAASPNPTTLPDPATPNQLIAPFWTDLDPSAGGRVLYDIYGTSPNRLYVVEWRSIPLKSGQGTVNFEVILFEGSSDVLFQYGEMPWPEVTSQAIIGMEYGQGTKATTIENTVQKTVSNGLSILLSVAPPECKACYRITAEALPDQAGVVRILPSPNCGTQYSEGTELSLAAAAGEYSYQWAESVTASSMDDAYSLPVGAPKVGFCGNNFDAWNPSKWGYTQEWLLLTYPQAVYAAGVSIHETNLGGFVSRVDFIEPDGTSHTVWQGTESTTCGEWFTPPLELQGITTDYLVKSVKVYTQKWGWEQLDAVKLVHLEDSGYAFDYWNDNNKSEFHTYEVNESVRLSASFSQKPAGTAAANESTDEKIQPKSTHTPTPVPVSSIHEEVHEGSSFSAAEDDIPMSWFIPSHFVHNWISSSLVLPVTLVNDSLRNTVTSQTSVWAENWQGEMSAGSALLLLFNLVLIALGTGCAWTHWRFAGVMPWITFFGYSLGTAVARTSGGRYIVPIDWVFYLYFAIGLVQITIWLAALLGFHYKNTPDGQIETSSMEYAQTSQKHNFLQKHWKGILVLLLCVLLGASPLLTDHAFPAYFDTGNKEQAYLTFIEHTASMETGLDNAELAAFVQDENSFVWIGKLLYPRFYKAGEGEPNGGMYGVMDFPRLVFTIIGPGGPNLGARAANGILPMPEAPDTFPQAADGIVIGCRNGDVNVLAVLLMDKNGDIVYSRTPERPLSCPLHLPVCNQEDECQ